MVKFAKKIRPLGAVATIEAPRTRTYEGALAYTRDAKSELFLLAITNMVAEKTFYESADQRDARFVTLIHEVTNEDPLRPVAAQRRQHAVGGRRDGGRVRGSRWPERSGGRCVRSRSRR